MINPRNRCNTDSFSSQYISPSRIASLAQSAGYAMPRFKVAFSIFLFFLFGAFLNSEAQTTIWSENFDSYSDKTTTAVKDGVTWTGLAKIDKDFIYVENKTIYAEVDDDDADRTWITSDIDISGYSNVNVSVDLLESKDNHTNNFIRVDFLLSGTSSSSTTSITKIGNFNAATISGGPFSNFSKLVIRITVHAHTKKTAKYYFDNVVVSGTADPCSNDTEVPTIDCSSITNPTQINADGGCGINIPDLTGSVAASDNCSSVGNITITQSPAPGTYVTGSGMHVVTLTATDESNNSSSCLVDVEAVDVTPPAFSCNSPASVSPDVDKCYYTAGTSGNLYPNPGSDNCGYTITNDRTGTSSLLNETFYEGDEIVWIATDDYGNSSQCTVVVDINFWPSNVLSFSDCPAGISATSPDGNPVTVSWTEPIAQITGNGCIASVVSNLNPGDSFPVGTTTVTYTATDGEGNTATCEFHVTVESNVDTEAPVITCSTNVSQYLDSSCEFSLPDYASSIVVTDNVDPNPTVTQYPVAGTLISSSTFVTIIATDDSGNSSYCSFGVLLNEDGTLQNCSDQTLVADDQCEYTISGTTYDVSLPASCFNSAITNDLNNGLSLDGETLTIGTTTINWSGNYTSYNPVSYFSWNDASKSPLTADYGLDAASSGSVEIRSGGINGNCLVPLNDDIEMILPGGNLNLEGIDISVNYRRDESQANLFHRDNCLYLAGVNNMDITYRVEDGAGGFVEISDNVGDEYLNDNQFHNYRFVYNPNDGYGRIFRDGTEIWTSTNAYPGKKMYWQGAGDLVVGEVMDASNNETPTLDDLTIFEIKLNQSTCTQSITVSDTEAPTAICQDISVTIGVGGQATVAAADVDNGSMDNCTSSGNLIVKIDGQDQLTFDCTNVGVNTVTLSVEDESGNSNTCQAQVTVVNAAPSFSSCPADISADLTSADVGGYWQYRKPVTITNSGSTLTDYQVRIDVSMESGKMNADFSDIRFRDSDGSTSLSFWLEQQNGSTAVFWVNVPSIGASKTIYVLYGNSVATSASNSSNTFIYFDDMNTASGWTDVANGGSVTTNSSVFGYNVLVKQDNDDPSGGQRSIGTTISDFKLITREQRASTGPAGASNGGSMDRYGLEDGSGNGYTLTRNADVSSTGTFGFEVRTSGSASGGSSSDVSQPRDNWYITELEKNGSAFVANIYEDNHSNLLGSESGSDATHNTFTHLAVRGGHFYYIDWMAVAKSASTEPSLSFGTEEVLGVSSCEKDVTVPQPSVSDDTGTYTLVNDFNGDADASGTYPVGTTTVTFTATDPCGETATCLLDVTVNDKVDPVIACSGNITADITNNPLTIPQPLFDDNCSGAVLANDFNGTADASGTYPAGTTTVVWTVTDASGNTATCSFDVTINEVCAISDVSFTPITCAGDEDASIQITAAGYGLLNYSIDGGVNTQTSNSFTGLAPGNYNVQISDESGCTTTWPTPIIIYESNDFSVTSSVTDASCFGNSDGAIDATLNSYLTKSIYFDGSDDYIAIDKSYNGTSAISALTVCAWVKCNSGEGGWSVLDLDRSEYFNVSLGPTNRSGNTIEFATNSDLGGGIDDMTGTISVKDGQWHHIAAVYDGTDKYLYVDGVLDSQKSNPHNGQPLGSNLTRYGFIGDGSEASGYDGGRNNNYYKGWIAEVDYWEKALTADEIKQRMHSTLSGSETNLVAYWSMEEGTGTSVSPQGTMINGPTWSDDIPYTYSWTKQGDGSFSASTIDISGLSAGTYDLAVTFNGNCVKTTSVEVAEPDELLISSAVSQISCDGLADGAVDITVTGGTEPYTFEWSTVDGSGLVTNDEDQTGLDVGTYDLTVTDGNSCVATGSYTITEPPVYSIIVSDQTDPSTCEGSDGVIELTLTNVPDGLYDISYDAGTFSGVSVAGELATITDLSAGTYNNLRITVGTCVTADDPDVVLADPPTPDLSDLSASLSGSGDICLNAAATIDITSSTLIDGTYTVTYDLSAPNASTGETAILVFATGSGSFTTTALANTGTTSLSITAIESSGCSVAASASVDILVDITPPVIATCPADASANCVENIPAGVTSYEDFALIGVVSDNCTSGTNLIVEFSDVTDKKDETNSCEVKRTYTITDEAGNSQTCTQTFTITDSTPPVIQDCPVDIIDIADNNCEKVMSIAAPTSFTDGCGFGDLIVYHQYTIESITVNGAGDIVDVAFPKGATVVTWSFEDECGNIGTCETVVTINDNTEPTASTPANPNLDAAGGCSVLIPDYSSLLTDLFDNCDPSPTITQEPVIGTEVFADTDIKLVFADESGNKDSVTFTAILTNLASLTISGMTYDGGQSGTGAVGSGQKPFITSTHTYVVDATESNPENYTYTWLVLDQSDTDVTASISFNNTEQTSADIKFEEASLSPGSNYTIRVIKEQNSGNCSAVFEFDVELQETNFNSGVSPLGDSCQDGGTGSTTVVFWDIDFTGGVEPYAFDFTVSDGTDGCTGSVSNLYTSDAQSISTSESCAGTYVVSVTKTSGVPKVQVAFTFYNEAGVDKDFSLEIDSATDNFSITKQTINNDENDDVRLWGVPNTSEITTD